MPTWLSDALANELWGDPRVIALIGGPFPDREIQEKL
jgi:hypothetical protein